ncbi:MAG: DUF3857 and transglutaminase domain-containing protein [bacterium]
MPFPPPLFRFPPVATAHRHRHLFSLICWLLCLLLSGPATPFAAEPTDLRDLIAATGDSEDYPDADVVIVFDRTEVDVEDSGLSHVVNRRLTKILTDRGAGDQGFQRFDYDPASQAIEVRHVTIWRADGGEETVDLTRLVDVTAPGHAIYWGARMLGLSLPRLQVGDAVEIETYRKGFQIAYLGENGAEDDSRYIPPMRGHYYDVILFQTDAPMREKTYTLRSRRDKPVQYSVYNGEVFAASTFDDSLYTYRFWAEDCPAHTREWRSPGVSDYVPKVVLATVQDWQEKSRWFYTVNDNQFADNPDIRAKVAEITDGLKDDEEIISAINHWVAQEIRYCGLSMGEGEGFTLHPGDMIFAERSGVCKDIAGMTITMLRSAGYEVYPAMTMAGSRVERIPADQFNHCVAALRRDDGSFLMLDPTWIPFAMSDWSRAEGEQHFVIGSPEGEDLMQTAAYSAEDNLVQLRIETRLHEDGELTGTVDLVGEGYSDTRIRRSIGFVPKHQIEQRLSEWLTSLGPGAELLEYEYGDHRDFSRPCRLELKFRLPGYARAGRTTLCWQSCAADLIFNGFGGLFRFAVADLPDERQTPTLIWYPQQVQISERIELPKGFQVTEPDEPWHGGDGDGIAACSLACSGNKNKLEISGTVTVRQRTIPAADWSTFKQTLDSLYESGQTFLVATRKGGRS